MCNKYKILLSYWDQCIFLLLKFICIRKFNNNVNGKNEKLIKENSIIIVSVLLVSLVKL